MTRIAQATPQAIEDAAALLRAGEVVAFPTETVYGLGADATNDDAVAKIYAVKGRPAHNPLIIHVASLGAAQKIGVFDARAMMVAENLWPGPLTLVVPLRPNQLDAPLAAKATAGLATVALRIPAHPVAMALLERAQCPVAAPSANPSGLLSPTAALHVAQGLQGKLPLILADGASAVGIESTILDLTSDAATILRPGAIGVEELAPLLGDVVFAAADAAVKAPGQLRRHYATQTPLRLNAVDVKAGEALLAFGKTNFIGVAGVGFARDMDDRMRRNLSPNGDLYEAATNLYAALHALDMVGATAIAVMPVPQTGLGIAINDRLSRAAVAKDAA